MELAHARCRSPFALLFDGEGRLREKFEYPTPGTDFSGPEMRRRREWLQETLRRYGTPRLGHVRLRFFETRIGSDSVKLERVPSGSTGGPEAQFAVFQQFFYAPWDGRHDT